MTFSEVLESARLYAIVDLSYVEPADLERVAAGLCAGGADLVQLRAKGATDLAIEGWAQRLAPIFADAAVPFIINDFPELVPAVGAQGAHVGQADLPIAEARWRAGRSLAGELPPPLIGKSTHSLTQATAAAAEGADYLGFGPLFPTPTKAGRPAVGLAQIREVQARVTVPVFCIGGIKRENLEGVLEAGAQRVVIVSGLLQARDLAAYGREVKARLLENCPRQPRVS